MITNDGGGGGDDNVITQSVNTVKLRYNDMKGMAYFVSL